MAFTSYRLNSPNIELQIELKRAAAKLDRENLSANITAARGLGSGRNRILTCFYKDYADYARAIDAIKSLPNINIDSINSFLVDLQNDFSYRILSMNKAARRIESLTKKEDVKT